MNYIMVLIADVLLAFDFALSKKYQSIETNSLAAGLRYNALSGIFTAIIFWIFSGFKVEFSTFSVVLALAMSLCAMAYSIMGFSVLKKGNMAIYSIFLMSGGMLLPYVFGVLFLDEKLSVFRIVGIILILGAIILSNNAKGKIKVSFIMLCGCIFILNGSVSIISKCHQINMEFPVVDSATFVMYSGICKFVLSLVALIFCKSNSKFKFSRKNTVFIILGSAVIGGGSYLLQLIGAKNIPATVLYPLITGGSIIFSSLSDKIFYKEKLSIYQLISIALCFVGTLLFL